MRKYREKFFFLNGIKAQSPLVRKVQMEQINIWKNGQTGNEFVDDVRSSGRPIASHLIHTGLPIFTSSAGSVLGGLATENPLGAVAGGMAGKYAGEALGDYIGHKTGYGLKKKRGKKQGGALLPAGY